MAHLALPADDPGHDLLVAARGLLADAAHTAEPADRFRLAHLSALRTAAAAARRARPASAPRRLQNVWTQLERRAPEYEGWARYFAAAAPVRAAVEAGLASAVSALAADDQLRAAADFLGVVTGAGLPLAA